MRDTLSAAGFENRARAETELAKVEARLAPSLLTPLASLLAESPDLDAALDYLSRYAESAPPDVLASLAQYPTALTYLIALFGTSPFLSEALIEEPALVVQFARDRNFAKLKSKKDFEQDFARFMAISADPWLSAQLARFKRRHMIRVALKDVVGLATLSETTLELSALADVILGEALAFCDLELGKRYGQPQYRDGEGRIVESKFAVISLGKLGGRELDYGSGMDLIFVYARDGETSGGSESESAISNKEYFVHLAHAVARTVSQPTPAGEVFRINLSGRPGGAEGEISISLASALAYYRRRATAPELQSLIRGRHSAGDAHLAREFLRGVESMVYGTAAGVDGHEIKAPAPPLFPRTLEVVRERTLNFRLERGGIRDIEFLTEHLQRRFGQSDAWVRGGGTILGLRRLNDKGWISDRDLADLTAAYLFLRKIELRIELEPGREASCLPSDRKALGRLARRLGYERSESGEEAMLLPREIQKVLDQMKGIYDRLIHLDARPGELAEFCLTPHSLWVADRGFTSFESLLASLGARAPSLASVVRQAEIPARSRPNVLRLFAAFFSSAERFSAARENPELIRRAVDAVGLSDYLAELLRDHPEDIRALDGGHGWGVGTEISETGQAFGQLDIPLDSSLWPEPFPWVGEPGIPLTEQMALLRSEFRARSVALAAADVAGVGLIDSALARWSALAAQAVASSLAIAENAYPEPVVPCRRAFPIAILALGRLGTNEFDLGCDAELVFVVKAGLSKEELAAANQFAARTLEVLSSHTREGSVLAVNFRLGPSGQAGDLAVAEDELLTHLRNSAALCEAVDFLNASPIVGKEEFVRQAAERLAKECLARFSGGQELERKIIELRRERNDAAWDARSGGSFARCDWTEVNFAVSAVRFRHRVELPPGLNTSRQIAALRSRGLLAQRDAEVLDRGSEFLRSVDHAIRLVTGNATEGLPGNPGQAESVEALLRGWGLLCREESLPARLAGIQREVQAACERIMDRD